MAARIARTAALAAIAGVVIAAIAIEPAGARDGWSYPRLHLVVGRHEGKTFIGAQAWARDGCHSLVGSSKRHHIRIRGMRGSDPPEGYGCTLAIEPEWQAIHIRRGWSIVRVTYRGKTGRYSVRVRPAKVRIRFRRGDDVAAPKVEKWWRIPRDVLIASAWYGRPEAIERMSEELDERLRENGATTFDTPEGWVIATGWPRAAPGHRGGELAAELTEELKRDHRRRVYLTDMTRRKLRGIAKRAVRTERCTYVLLEREPLGTGGVGPNPPCDRG